MSGEGDEQADLAPVAGAEFNDRSGRIEVEAVEQGIDLSVWETASQRAVVADRLRDYVRAIEL